MFSAAVFGSGRAHFRTVEEDRGPDAYLMEHQATIYLLDRLGKLKTASPRTRLCAGFYRRHLAATVQGGSCGVAMIK
jgi:hypothetical protein